MFDGDPNRLLNNTGFHSKSKIYTCLKIKCDNNTAKKILKQ